MPLDFQRARPLLQSGNLTKLFVEELGWEPVHQKLTLNAGETDYVFVAIAEKRGFTAWQCVSVGDKSPDHATRLKLDRKLSETSFEHLIVFAAPDFATQSWMWVRREQGKPLAARTHEFNRSQPGDSLLQKLQLLYVSLEEEEAGLSVTEIAGRARAAFDIELVTKAFFRDFDSHRKAFLAFIEGFPPPTKVQGKIKFDPDQEWYASVMLNRLMFVYFIQRKGFLDGDTNYLRNRLDRCKKEQGKDKFYPFYRYFLLRLFHEGFGKRRKDRAPDLEKLIGNIPYLNGGLFDVHELERPERYGKDIQIGDQAFERIFDYFDQYQWHLDERPLRADNEINPDVLGYIFEKYINQKEMGAYYTKEDITEYICKNTVLPFLFDAARAKCKVAFENGGNPTAWDLLRETPDRYIYPAVRHGVDKKLPPEIAAGLDVSKPDLAARRQAWNKPAPGEYALPAETWREVVARCQRYEEVKKKLAAGEVRQVNDFITLNLDLRQFAQDVIASSEGPELLRAIWQAIAKVTVVDPTCGSGAFLFAALNILEPLYEACLDRMEAFVADDEKTRPKSPEESARELIAAGESRFLEFKSTARWNVKESRADKVMEAVILKTVAAFLNSDGGDLLIGVQDDGSIFGIEADQKLFNPEKRTRDIFENWLMTQMLGAYGKQHAANLRVTFARLDGKDICRVTALPSNSAVYIKENGNEETLYVRTGNATRSLSTKEAVAYHQQRFNAFTPPSAAAASAKAATPKKYTDFRKVLETVAAHPNRRYFVLKSIIINNLFGVDIMEEAVEICKLRLFLKLAAQVEPDAKKDNLGIEPLPDIDFNIRAGNTLVGYATKAEVQQCMKEMGGGQMKLMGEDELGSFARFNTRCADVEQAFDKFRQLQTEGDGSVPAADKQELQKRLKALDDELNQQLAGECGVKIGDKSAYAKWGKSHHPFHWFIQFYGIMNSGGFDVIIGNPPYAEIPKDLGRALLRKTFKSALERWSRDEDLYTLVVERSLHLMKSHAGKYGMILPLSVAFSTKKPFVILRDVLASEKGHWLWSHFDRIPSALFGNDVRTRCTIAVLSRSHESQRFNAATTALLRWNAEYRDCLFKTLTFSRLDVDIIAGIPKVGSQIQANVLRSLLQAKTPLAIDLTRSVPFNVLADVAPKFPQPCVFVGGTAYNWFPAWRDIPETTNMDGDPSLPARTAGFRFSNEDDANIVFALLCSSMGYWWWAVASDAFNLKKWLMERFPVSVSMIPVEARKPLAKLGENLRRELKKNYVFKDNKGRIGNFFLPACEAEIVAIDNFLGTAVPKLSVEFFQDVRNFNASFSRADLGEEEKDDE